MYLWRRKTPRVYYTSHFCFCAQPYKSHGFPKMADKKRNNGFSSPCPPSWKDMKSRDTIHLQPPPASSAWKFSLPSRVSKISVSMARFVFMPNTFISITQLWGEVLNECILVVCQSLSIVIIDNKLWAKRVEAISFSTERNVNTITFETTALWKRDFCLIIL